MKAFALALALLPPADIPAIQARMAALSLTASVEQPQLYTPAETVKGGRAADLPAAPGLIAADALDRAAAYADAEESFALIVAKNGRIVRETYWRGFGVDSRFSTASMHKTVLALAYGPAVARGRIRLDDPAARWLPEWRDDPRGKITIRQLLSMTSGLEGPFSRDPAALGTRLLFDKDIRAVALAFPALQPPGTEFAYANVNSELAGLALERAVGGRYADWLSRAIWRPIGAEDAQLWLDRPGGAPHYYCCLQARARDWLLIGELIRNRGRAGGRQVVPADWVREMAAPSPMNPNFGLHLWRGSPYAAQRRYSRTSPLVITSSAPFAADDVLFLDGAGAQRVYVVPSAGLTIVRIGKPSLKWDETRLVNLVLAGIQSNPEPQPR